MVIKRRYFSGYGETMMDGAEYMSAQVRNGLAENVLDPVDRVFEKWDELPEPLQPRGKVKRVRQVINPLSRLLKRGKKNKTKNKNK